MAMHAPIAGTPLGAPLTLNILRELDAIDLETARLASEPASEAEWHRWEEWTCRVWREAEALPPTAENAGTKARAVWSIIGGDLEELNMGQSTASRLVRQIVSTLANVGGSDGKD